MSIDYYKYRYIKFLKYIYHNLFPFNIKFNNN